MGVPGLWDLLRPAGQPRSLTHLAVVDGFQENQSGHRGFRVGIDASIWFFHAAYGREGENPELRTLFFRCSRFLGMPFLPLFVFDGPKRPSIKRNKRISGNAHWLTNGMKNIIEAFGFEWRTAPGEAEAELAFLNRAGLIDAVISDDVDTFVFGATMVVRNPSSTLSGNRAHPTSNSSGKDDGNHATIYKSKDFQRPDISLTHGGLILIAILSGGDYHQAGLPRCGPNIAHGLAKCGFGDSLLHAAQTMSRDELVVFLSTWRQDIRDELRTNARGIIGRKNPALAKSVPDDFPDTDILFSYTNPITSESEGKAHRINFVWNRKLDLGRIAHICELYFEWGVRNVIIKRFRTVIWPAAVLRLLREEALLLDEKSSLPTKMSTPRKKRCGQSNPTPSPPSQISQGLSSLHLSRESNDRMIVKIHSSRNHASTDGLLEYRLEITPKSIVDSAEAGIKDIRPPLIDDLQDDDDDDDQNEDAEINRSGKNLPDPYSHFRVWIPACIVREAEPSMVDDYEEDRKRKQEKKTKTKKLTATKHAPKNASEPADLPNQVIENVPTTRDKEATLEVPKGRHLKNFFPTRKTGGQLVAKNNFKGGQTTKVISQTQMTSPTTGSRVIDALDRSNRSIMQTQSPRKAPPIARPFPVTFSSDSEDPFADDHGASWKRRARPSSSHSEPDLLEKSPRKSAKHTSPRSKPTQRTEVAQISSSRATSPSPSKFHPLPSQIQRDAVIEISSDSDEEKRPTPCLKSTVAPLLLAKARARPRVKEQTIKKSDDIIDLT